MAQSVFGLTKGGVSLIDIISQILDDTGQANLDISTWTVGMGSLERLASLNTSRLRLLIDRSYGSRNPEYKKALFRTLGAESIRVGINHSKVVTVCNEQNSVLLVSSMNLNRNRRLESFVILHDGEATRFFTEQMDYYFNNPLVDFGDWHKVRAEFEAMGAQDTAPMVANLEAARTLRLDDKRMKQMLSKARGIG